MTEIVTNHTSRDILKRSKIAAKEFTYVQIWLAAPDGGFAGAREIVVCTPSKPVAAEAVRAIISAEGLKTRGCGMRGDGEHFSLYPRTYIREAKALLASNPSRVYLVTTVANS